MADNRKRKRDADAVIDLDEQPSMDEWAPVSTAYLDHIRRVTSGAYSPSLHDKYDSLTQVGSARATEERTKWQEALLTGYDKGNNLRVPPLLNVTTNEIIKTTNVYSTHPYWLAGVDAYWSAGDERVMQLQAEWTGKTLQHLVDHPKQESPLWMLFRRCWELCGAFFTVYKLGNTPVDAFASFMVAAGAFVVQPGDVASLHELALEARDATGRDKNIVPLIELGIWPAVEIYDQTARGRTTVSSGMMAILTVIATGVHLARWTLPKLFCHMHIHHIEAAAAATPRVHDPQSLWVTSTIPADAPHAYEKIYEHMRQLRESFVQSFAGWDIVAYSAPLPRKREPQLSTYDREAFELASYNARVYEADVPSFMKTFLTNVNRQWAIQQPDVQDPHTGAVVPGYLVVKEDMQYISYALIAEVVQSVQCKQFVARTMERFARVAGDAGTINQDELGDIKEILKKDAELTDVFQDIMTAMQFPNSGALFWKYFTDACERFDKHIRMPDKKQEDKEKIYEELRHIAGEALVKEWTTARQALYDWVENKVNRHKRVHRGAFEMPTTSHLFPIWLRLAVVEELAVQEKVLLDFFSKDYHKVISAAKREWVRDRVIAVLSLLLQWIRRAHSEVTRADKVDLYAAKNIKATVRSFHKVYDTALEASKTARSFYTQLDTFHKTIETAALAAQAPGKTPQDKDALKAEFKGSIQQAADIAGLNNLATASANAVSGFVHQSVGAFFGHTVGTGMFTVYARSWGEALHSAFENTKNEYSTTATSVPVGSEIETFDVIDSAVSNSIMLGLPWLANILYHGSEVLYQKLMTIENMNDKWQPAWAIATILTQFATLGAQSAVLNTMLMGMSGGWLGIGAVAGSATLGLTLSAAVLPLVALIFVVGPHFYRRDGRPWSYVIPSQLRSMILYARIAQFSAHVVRAVSMSGSYAVALAKREWVKRHEENWEKIANTVLSFAGAVLKKVWAWSFSMVGATIAGVWAGAVALQMASSRLAVALFSRIYKWSTRAEPAAKRAKVEVEVPAPARLNADLRLPSDAEFLTTNSLDYGMSAVVLAEPAAMYLADSYAGWMEG